MRVLHVVPDLSRAFGGPTQALLGYLAASRAVGIEACVAAPEPPPEDLAWFRAQAAGVRVDVFPSWAIGSSRITPKLVRYLRAHLHSTDIVHVHGMFNAVSTLAARSCRGANVPYIIGPFGTLSRYTFDHRHRLLKRAYFALLDAPVIRAAGALLFTTVQERDDARRLLAVRATPAAVVPPPWIPDAGSRTESPRQASSVRGDLVGPTVLFLSRLHPKKGLETLIDAWPAIRAVHPKARLIIAGSGDAEYERDLKARVMQHSGDQSVKFTGFVTGADKARWLSEADLFVLPSFNENFGVAVLDAIAAGLPVVISPDVQLATVVQEYRLGVITPREPAMLANGILTVLADSMLRDRCASQGAAIVHSLFSPQAIGPQMRAMYELARSKPALN
jgi:glycosyltransferase involved in cell wall biosynthesis